MPQGSTKTVLMGNSWPEVSYALNKLGIDTLILPTNSSLDKPVRDHADLSAFYCGGGNLIVSRSIYSELNEDTTGELHLITAEKHQGSQYPLDIGLNACEVGNFIFCNEQHTDAEVLRSAQERGKLIVNVRQGYSRCSVCILDEEHIITADPSLEEAAKRCGIEVLRITPGFFELPGYDHGFIGGSCVKLHKNTLAFTGHITGHCNEREILEFINKCNINVVYLTDRRCFDIGTIIPVKEEI